jgi:hypothetical protein
VEHGGVLHFADQDGGAPRGSIEGMENVRVVQQVMNGSKSPEAAAKKMQDDAKQQIASMKQ